MRVILKKTDSSLFWMFMPELVKISSPKPKSDSKTRCAFLFEHGVSYNIKRQRRPVKVAHERKSTKSSVLLNLRQ